MNENLDLTEILKDCPKGTKFYSTIYGEVKFIRIDNKSIDYPIDFNTFDGYTISLTSDGRCDKSYDGECTFFPSKDQRDWSKWHRPFVDGDIVTDIEGAIIIYKKITTCGYCGSFVSLDHRNQFVHHYKSYLDCIRLATEEEKKKLFDAIKANGYKWDAETKTLKELKKEKFKDLIEAPSRVDDFLERIKIKSVIARTLRLTLQNPELAQEYLDNLPKAVCENVPTPSMEQ